MNRLVRSITPDEIAAYRNAGVVLLKGLLDLPTINTVRRCIDSAVATLGQSASGYDLSKITEAFEHEDRQSLAAQSDGQHDVAAIMKHVRASGRPLLLDSTSEGQRGSFLLDTGVTARIKDFKRFATRGAAPEIAAALLGGGAVRLFDDQIFVKEPNTRERTAFHQDSTYMEIDGDQCCVLWIPVDPVTTETGGMVYIRGSHRDGKRYRPNVFISQATLPGAEGDELPDIEGHPEDHDLVSFDVEPGDVLVHHYHTVHGAGGNLSRYQVRRAATIRYAGDDIRAFPRAWAPKRLHLSNEFIKGSPLTEPDYPVVWRRQYERTAA